MTRTKRGNIQRDVLAGSLARSNLEFIDRARDTKKALSGSGDEFLADFSSPFRELEIYEHSEYIFEYIEFKTLPKNIALLSATLSPFTPPHTLSFKIQDLQIPRRTARIS